MKRRVLWLEGRDFWANLESSESRCPVKGGPVSTGLRQLRQGKERHRQAQDRTASATSSIQQDKQKELCCTNRLQCKVMSRVGEMLLQMIFDRGARHNNLC